MMFMQAQGVITKEEYASTLRAHHERQTEMKSDTRDLAAAAAVFGWTK